MLGPNTATVHLANADHEARIQHAALINQFKREQHADRTQVTIETHRKLTVRRLAAAGLAGFVLSAAIVASGATAVAAAPHSASGGGAHLIR